MKNSLSKWLSHVYKGTTCGYATRKDCLVIFGFLFLIGFAYAFLGGIWGKQIHDIIYYIPSLLTIIATFSLMFMRINDIFGKWCFMKGRVLKFIGINFLIEIFGRIIAKILFNIEPIDSSGWSSFLIYFLLCVYPSSSENREEMPIVEYKLPKKTILILIVIATTIMGLYLYFADLDAIGYNDRGVTYFDEGNCDMAIEDLNQAIKLEPNMAVAYSNRGNAYNCKGNYDMAIVDLNQAIQLDSNLAIAYNIRGLVYQNKGNYDVAIEDLNQAILLDSNMAEAYNNRGLAYHGKSNYDFAIENYNKAIQLNPYLVEAYNNRGLTYRYKGDYDKAIEDYSKAILLNSNLAMVYYNRGYAYYGKGNYDMAIADYSQAIRLIPNFAMAYYYRGYVYLNGKNDYDMAIADFETTLQIDPNHTEANQELARIQLFRRFWEMDIDSILKERHNLKGNLLQ